MIRFEHVQKWYGKHHVLKDLSLEVGRGEICLLCGRSGAGKSTLLATANGIEPIQGGAIWVDGAQLHGRGTDLRQLRTQIGVVYQHHNLFGHMSVEKNLRLGLEKVLKVPKTESIRRARYYLDRVGLGHKWDAFPAELSGGEQQRVAIARCLAMQPKLMLLDEPTSALDAENAAEVVETIRLLAHEGITVLLSTHLITSFTDIAHCYVCMEGGAITEGGRLERSLVQLGAPTRLASLIHARRNTGETPIEPADPRQATG